VTPCAGRPADSWDGRSATIASVVTQKRATVRRHPCRAVRYRDPVMVNARPRGCSPYVHIALSTGGSAQASDDTGFDPDRRIIFRSGGVESRRCWEWCVFQQFGDHNGSFHAEFSTSGRMAIAVHPEERGQAARNAYRRPWLGSLWRTGDLAMLLVATIG